MEILLLAVNTFAPVAPDADHFDFPLRRLLSHHGSPIRPHYREERLNTMNAVPKQVRMMRLYFARPIGFRISNFSDRTISDLLGVFPKSQCRSAKHRHP